MHRIGDAGPSRIVGFGRDLVRLRVVVGGARAAPANDAGRVLVEVMCHRRPGAERRLPVQPTRNEHGGGGGGHSTSVVLASTAAAVNRSIQFGRLILESTQEGAALLEASVRWAMIRSVQLIVVKHSARLLLLVAVLIDFGQITLTATDQIDNRWTLQLRLFVAQMRIRFVHHGRIGRDMARGEFLDVNRTGIVGAVQTVNVEAFAAVQCLVRSRWLGRTGVVDDGLLLDVDVGCRVPAELGMVCG